MIQEGGFGWPQAIVLLVALQRTAELAYAQRNLRALLAAGGVEHGAGHYPLLVGLHASWLAAIFLLVPAGAAIQPLWLVVFLLLQAARIWVLAALGRFWTTRVIALPDTPLVTGGPYRFCKHPNYAVVAGEIAVLPLVFGAWRIALIFTLLNAVLLWWRIRVENATLALRPPAGTRSSK